MTEPGSAVDEATIERAVSELLRRESHAYVTLWESLTKNEQRLLRGLADSETAPQAVLLRIYSPLWTSIRLEFAARC
jgi:hypothetical protein